jgi:hypothetical protein
MFLAGEDAPCEPVRQRTNKAKGYHSLGRLRGARRRQHPGAGAGPNTLVTHALEQPSALARSAPSRANLSLPSRASKCKRRPRFLTYLMVLTVAAAAMAWWATVTREWRALELRLREAEDNSMSSAYHTGRGASSSEIRTPGAERPAPSACGAGLPASGRWEVRNPCSTPSPVPNSEAGFVVSALRSAVCRDHARRHTLCTVRPGTVLPRSKALRPPSLNTARPRSGGPSPPRCGTPVQPGVRPPLCSELHFRRAASVSMLPA